MRRRTKKQSAAARSISRRQTIIFLSRATDPLALSADDPVLHSRPSIDVFFESAADIYGSALVGIVLSGANHDGAAGLRAIAAAGGVALVEDPANAYAPTMPRAALEACVAARSMSLSRLASYLVGLRKTART